MMWYSKYMRETYKNMLSKPEIQFWIPIIIYTVTLTIAFMSLRMELLEIKNIAISNNELLTQKLTSYVDRTDRLTNAVNVLETHMCVIDSFHQIKCINSN